MIEQRETSIKIYQGNFKEKGLNNLSQIEISSLKERKIETNK